MINNKKSPLRSVERARIVMMASEGHENQSIAKALGISCNKAARWRKRYAEIGSESLWNDAKGRVCKPRYSKEDVESVVKTTIENVPEGRTHWSRSSMAEFSEMSESTVGRIWVRYGLKPTYIKRSKFQMTRISLKSLRMSLAYI